MSNVKEYYVAVAGGQCRVLEKGTGDPLVYVPGFGACPRWIPFWMSLPRGAA